MSQDLPQTGTLSTLTKQDDKPEKKQQVKIGVFGGTFDPPHKGHLLLAETAAEALGLDEVLWLPANKNPLKSRRAYASGKQRLEMIKLVIHGTPKFTVADLDLTRGGPSYAIDSLFELKHAREADYWFLMGADSLRDLPNWKQVQGLLKLCRVAAVVRPPATFGEIIQYLPESIAEKVDPVEMPPSIISSSEIRESVMRGRPIDQWVTPAIRNYIRDNKLYTNL